MWCASFMDIRRYRICSVLFTFSSVSQIILSSRIIMRSFLPGTLPRLFIFIVKVFHFPNYLNFQIISWGLFQILYLKPNLLSNFCKNKAFFLGEWGKDFVKRFKAFPDACLLWYGDFFKSVVGIVNSCFCWWYCCYFLWTFLILILSLILYSSYSFVLNFSLRFAFQDKLYRQQHLF